MLHDTSRYQTSQTNTSRYQTSRSDFTISDFTISDFTQLHAYSRLFHACSCNFTPIHAYSRLFTSISRRFHKFRTILMDIQEIVVYFVIYFIYSKICLLVGAICGFTLFHAFSRSFHGFFTPCLGSQLRTNVLNYNNCESNVLNYKRFAHNVWAHRSCAQTSGNVCAWCLEREREREREREGEREREKERKREREKEGERKKKREGEEERPRGIA